MQQSGSQRLDRPIPRNSEECMSMMGRLGSRRRTVSSLRLSHRTSSDCRWTCEQNLALAVTGDRKARLIRYCLCTTLHYLKPTYEIFYILHSLLATRFQLQCGGNRLYKFNQVLFLPGLLRLAMIVFHALFALSAFFT